MHARFDSLLLFFAPNHTMLFSGGLLTNYCCCKITGENRDRYPSEQLNKPVEEEEVRVDYQFGSIYARRENQNKAMDTDPFQIWPDSERVGEGFVHLPYIYCLGLRGSL